MYLVGDIRSVLCRVLVVLLEVSDVVIAVQERVSLVLSLPELDRLQCCGAKDYNEPRSALFLLRGLGNPRRVL